MKSNCVNVSIDSKTVASRVTLLNSLFCSTQLVLSNDPLSLHEKALSKSSFGLSIFSCACFAIHSFAFRPLRQQIKPPFSLPPYCPETHGLRVCVVCEIETFAWSLCSSMIDARTCCGDAACFMYEGTNLAASARYSAGVHAWMQTRNELILCIFFRNCVALQWAIFELKRLWLFARSCH